MTTATATAPRLSPSLQALIDLRLDTIDRMLLSRMPREDRVNIVSEVEAQIFELLGEREAEEPTRDDVLVVLARLDPPEAYLPETDDAQQRPSERRNPSRPAGVARSTPRNEPRSAKAGAILGFAALGCFVLLMPVIYLLAAITESEAIMILGLLLAAGAMFVCALLGVILGVHGGLRGAWSVLGVVTGGIALIIWLSGGLLVLAAGI